MLLEGTGRKRLSTGIPRAASTAEGRKILKARAEEVYHGAMVRLARQAVGLPIASRESFARYSAWYETHHTATHRSAPRERFILAHLRAHFGQLALSDITRARWQEYETARRAAGVAVSTIGRELAVMKTILASAVGEHLEVSPLAHVKRRSTTLPPKRTITAAEEARLLEHLQPGKVKGGTYGDAEMHDLYLLGVGTLLRQMNLITLQRKHVHGERVSVFTKTGQHTVSLAGPTELQRRCTAILAARMPKSADGYFFPKWQKRFATSRDGANAKFLAKFHRACTRAGIPWGLHDHGVVWHTATRASGATRLLQDYGVDIRTVQVIGGWRSLDQMAAYLGVSLEGERRVNGIGQNGQDSSGNGRAGQGRESRKRKESGGKRAKSPKN